MFRQPETPQMAPPTAPSPPPNPPMFGQNSSGASSQRRQASGSRGFSSTVLGGLASAPATSNRTLLGQ